MSADGVRHTYGVGAFLFLIGAVNGIRTAFVRNQAALNKILGLQKLLVSLLSYYEVEHTSVKMKRRLSIVNMFTSMDVGTTAGGGSDGNLDFIEVYNAFTKAGARRLRALLK